MSQIAILLTIKSARKKQEFVWRKPVDNVLNYI